MTDIQIQISNKTFSNHADDRAHHVIAAVDLNLHSGEFVCLVGPSGCGKTTLLNMIAGLDQQFQGVIKLGNGHSQAKVGYVFQTPRLLPWRTVRENIELAMPAEVAPEMINTLLAAMDLSNMENVYPERLSLGMSRRVAIIRAFAVNPDILLMDEPFVSLDPPTARQVRNLLLNLWQQRPHTVLFVTHDLREAITLADRLIFLSKPPMQIINQVNVDIPRKERHDDEKIEKFRSHLINNFPKIQSLL